MGCVFQDMKPPKSIPRKSSDMPKPIQRVKFTKAIASHSKIRDQNPPLGYICPGEPHQRIPNAPKFEDRSQEETAWQEQAAREAAWKLAKSVIKLEEQERATFSPSDNSCLPEMWFLTIDPFVGIPVFIAKLSERQYCWRGFEHFHNQEYIQFFDIHRCLFMRLHFSIGGYDYRKTARFRQSIHFSITQVLFC